MVFCTRWMESFTTVQSFRASILISIDLLNDEVIMKLLIWNLFFKLIVGVWLSFWGVSVFLHGMFDACPFIFLKIGHVVWHATFWYHKINPDSRKWLQTYEFRCQYLKDYLKHAHFMSRKFYFDFDMQLLQVHKLLTTKSSQISNSNLLEIYKLYNLLL